MPNRKVKYFKPIEEIKEKIIYINDKEFLGYTHLKSKETTISIKQQDEKPGHPISSGDES